MDALTYSDARLHIQTGDTIAIMGRSGLLAALTRFFTRSDYTHIGIAFWMGGALWMFEINSGRNHAIPLSQLQGTNFDVYARPPELGEAAVMESILANLRDKIDYGFLAIPVIGLFEYLKIKASTRWRDELVCSGIAVKVYEDAGWPPRSRLVSPARLVAMLDRRLSVRDTAPAPAQQTEAAPMFPG